MYFGLWKRAILEAAFVVRGDIKSKAIVDAGYAVRGTQRDINSRWKAVYAKRSTLLKYKLIREREAYEVMDNNKRLQGILSV